MTTDVDLFGNPSLVVPKTEGIKYAGSKLKLLPYILQLISKFDVHSVLDGFSGTTRVSQALAQRGYQVMSNDISEWSKVFATCYLLNKKKKSYYEPLIQHLNALPPKDGWFSEHYGGSGKQPMSNAADGFKKPWQLHNTRKLDAIRDEIDNLNLPDVEKSVLLTSLLLALDDVDSTMGHFSSYLKEWSPRSYKPMMLNVPSLILSDEPHDVFCQDVFQTIASVKADLAYFDPPYGSSNEKMPPSRVRYAAYYHVWTTVCKNDKPDVFGNAKRRQDTSDKTAGSVFEDFRKTEDGKFVVIEALERLTRQTNARYILLSYSSGGRATKQQLLETLEQIGTLREAVCIDYQKNVMSKMRWTNEWIAADEPTIEYLFLIEKKF
jgi:adenine-specific DNA-methyltransferase